MTTTTEFLIVGGGIVSLTLAKELLAQGADHITILEKESELGVHASGRNSGVLHAGIYYPPETLKAQLCLKGNLMLQDYCREKNLPLGNVGKVIVARNQDELPMLENLYHRAIQNGAKVDLIDEQQLANIEPHAKTCQKALYSHYTAIVNNKMILESLYQDLKQSGKVTLQFNTAFIKPKDSYTAVTTNGDIRFKKLINAAGAYADKVAHAFETGKSYYLIPFKGIYKKLTKEQSHLVNGNIYPVPDLRNPFLGVHFTRNLQGDVYIGPTAIPAFGRENYGKLQGIDAEAAKIITHQIAMFFTNEKFRSVALEEPKKYIFSYFFNDAKKLVKELKKEWIVPTGKVGIRPQLIDVKEKELLMDFLVLKDNHVLHILNAISPAFTSSMAFAKYVVNNYLMN
ncbi:MAG: L-2-hydroxyglutarate oxidase [Gammaproteobacteria bacterium]|nr:MAG: L-2-hydroxyglutarate oxidase [Gammaproteobacteria bacterium]